VIVAHARKVRLIGESRKKDDRLDAQTLARLARIDPAPEQSQPIAKVGVAAHPHRSSFAQMSLLMSYMQSGSNVWEGKKAQALEQVNKSSCQKLSPFMSQVAGSIGSLAKRRQ
jgi:hypothetical protein